MPEQSGIAVKPTDTVDTGSPDDLLYHYTSLEAFVSIIESRILRATHIHYMNDTSEQAIVWQLVRARVEERLAHARGRNKGRLKQTIDALAENKKSKLFVVCFSKDQGNRLSQWRAYGGSGGVSMGFSQAALHNFCVTRNGRAPVMLTDVEYVQPAGGEEIDRRIDTIIDNMLDSKQLSKFISIFAGQSKHAAFAEEQEWRLLMATGKGLKYRTRGSLLVPYIELELGDALPELLKAVCIGPSDHKELTGKALAELLYTHKLWDVSMRVSTIPYRGF